MFMSHVPTELGCIQVQVCQCGVQHPVVNIADPLVLRGPMASLVRLGRTRRHSELTMSTASQVLVIHCVGGLT